MRASEGKLGREMSEQSPALVWLRGRSVVGLLPRGFKLHPREEQQEIGESEALSLIKGRVGNLLLLDGELYRLYLLGDPKGG